MIYAIEVSLDLGLICSAAAVLTEVIYGVFVKRAVICLVEYVFSLEEALILLEGGRLSRQ